MTCSWCKGFAKCAPCTEVRLWLKKIPWKPKVLLISFLTIVSVLNLKECIWHFKQVSQISFFEELGDKLRASPQEEEMIRDLFRAFAVIATNCSIPYFLYGGSLIGYFRNNSLLAWDDDVDVAMPYSKFECFMSTLNNTMTMYGSWRHAKPYQYLFKIYSKQFYSVYNKDRNFPFLDIFMYTTKKSKLWIGNYKYDLRKIYPSKNGTFMDMKIPVPHSVRHVLENTYGKGVFANCTSNHRNHRNNSGLTVKSVPCRTLSYRFRFKQINGSAVRPIQADPAGDIFLRQADRLED